MTASPDMVDWDLANTAANWLIRPGPNVSAHEAASVVTELRRDAGVARDYVGEFTQLDAPYDGAPVLVVDRHGWVAANVAGLRVVAGPLAERLFERRGKPPSGATMAIGSRVTGVEAGSLLAYLSHRVLGQYEIFGAGGRPPTGRAGAGGRPPTDRAGAEVESTGFGRLLLVAPNVVSVERTLGVDPRDFRLWVCLHEETHRTQFSAVSWLHDYLLGEIRAFMLEAEVDPGALADRVRDAVGAILAARRSGEQVEGEQSDSMSLVDLIRTPRQREILDRLIAVMSLLEGHADYVMDGVGPEVVPSVAEIRHKFNQRRQRGAGRLDAALRRLLGLDAKLRQYRDGERFVRYVVQRQGMAGFNDVWLEPAALPTRTEIADPAAWIRRMHGGRATDSG